MNVRNGRHVTEIKPRIVHGTREVTVTLATAAGIMVLVRTTSDPVE